MTPPADLVAPEPANTLPKSIGEAVKPPIARPSRFAAVGCTTFAGWTTFLASFSFFGFVDLFSAGFSVAGCVCAKTGPVNTTEPNSAAVKIRNFISSLLLQFYDRTLIKGLIGLFVVIVPSVHDAPG